MLKRLNSVNIIEVDEVAQSLANWCFNSHYWVEYIMGYFQCEWCKELCTAITPITQDFPLCKKNPSLEKFIMNNIGDYIDPENELC